jgi:hypothetical protein
VPQLLMSGTVVDGAGLEANSWCESFVKPVLFKSGDQMIHVLHAATATILLS